MDECPDVVAHQVQSDEDDCGSSSPGELELVIAVRIARLSPVSTVAITPDSIGQRQLGDHKNGPRDGERQHKLVVDGVPVIGRDMNGEPPRLAKKK